MRKTFFILITIVITNILNAQSILKPEVTFSVNAPMLVCSDINEQIEVSFKPIINGTEKGIEYKWMEIHLSKVGNFNQVPFEIGFLDGTTEKMVMYFEGDSNNYVYTILASQFDLSKSLSYFNFTLDGKPHTVKFNDNDRLHFSQVYSEYENFEIEIGYDNYQYSGKFIIDNVFITQGNDIEYKRRNRGIIISQVMYFLNKLDLGGVVVVFEGLGEMEQAMIIYEFEDGSYYEEVSDVVIGDSITHFIGKVPTKSPVKKIILVNTTNQKRIKFKPNNPNYFIDFLDEMSKFKIRIKNDRN